MLPLNFEKFIENYHNIKCTSMCKLLVCDLNGGVKSEPYRIVRSLRRLHGTSV